MQQKNVSLKTVVTLGKIDMSEKKVQAKVENKVIKIKEQKPEYKKQVKPEAKNNEVK